jgi:hypothetical protein
LLACELSCPSGTERRGGLCFRLSALAGASGGSAGEGGASGAPRHDREEDEGNAVSGGAMADAGAHEGEDGPRGGRSAADAGEHAVAEAGRSAASAGERAEAGSSGASAPGARCGDGVTEGAERCDGKDCPTECTTQNKCLVASLHGSCRQMRLRMHEGGDHGLQERRRMLRAWLQACDR